MCHSLHSKPCDLAAAWCTRLSAAIRVVTLTFFALAVVFDVDAVVALGSFTV